MTTPMPARRALGAAALLLAALAAATPVRASDPPAPPVVGRVTDPTGTPLPNVQVAIAEIGRTTTTSADGSFVFRALRPGTYHLDATLLGYAPGHATVVVPETGDAPVRAEITLRPTPLAIEGINVTASPASADPLDITQSTLELSGKSLDRRVGASVAQTLSAEPGMGVRYGGPATSTPVIRGLSGERVLVLENGQRAGDLSSTSADHALSVDPLAAARIEVVRGPASLLYGNNALGGVVNVISPDIPSVVPARVEGFVAAQGESVNPGGALSAALTAPLGEHLAVTARGGGRSVDDVRVGGGDVQPNTFYDNRYGQVGLGLVRERATGGVTAGVHAFEYGLPFRPGHEEGGVTIDGRRAEAEARMDLALGRRGFTELSVEGAAQWYEHDEVEPSGEVGTHFDLSTQTASATARTQLGRREGAVGVSGLFKQYAPAGEEALTPGADTRSGGVFVYQEAPLGAGERAPRLQAGARWDVYATETEPDAERFGPARERTFRSVSGSLGLNVPLSGGLSASVSVARAFRAPTVEELYADGFHHAAGTYDVGNPGLRAETNRGAEAVLRAQTERVHGQLSAFYNRIDDYVFANPVGDTLIAHEDEMETVAKVVYAQADAELRGVEGQLETALTRRFVVGVMGDWVRGDFVDGGPLPFIPAARLGGSARWDDGRFSLGMEVRHAFEQDRVTQPGCDGEEESCIDVPADAYTLAHLTAGLRLIRGGLVHSLTLRADNVLDEEYRDAASRVKSFALNPGRNLSLVYRVLF